MYEFFLDKSREKYETEGNWNLSHCRFPQFPQNNLTFRKLRKPSGVLGKYCRFPIWVFPDAYLHIEVNLWSIVRFDNRLLVMPLVSYGAKWFG